MRRRTKVLGHVMDRSMDSIVVVKVGMPEASLPQGIEGGVISVYTVKSIFDGMKKTYMVES